MHAAYIGLIAGTLSLLAACATPPVTATTATAGRDTPAPQIGAAIWVLNSGWHTGLVLQRDELGAGLSALLQPARRASYLMFGWGNRRFYMAPDPTLGMDIAALFPSRSTVLVEGCSVAPRSCYTRAVKLHIVRLSLSQQARLDQYLLHTFQQNKAGQADPLGPGPDPDSEFYASGLRYDAFHTCNTWTAEALHKTGLPIHAHGVIFADQLWSQLQRVPEK